MSSRSRIGFEARNSAEAKEDVEEEQDASDIASVKFESTEEKPDDAESEKKPLQGRDAFTHA